MTDDRLGGFEEIVLLAVAGLRGQGYGVTLQQQIESGTGRPVTLGAVYATLDRLEKKGLVTSSLGKPTPERGGRRKRCYAITASGVSALGEMHRIRSTLRKAIPAPIRP